MKKDTTKKIGDYKLKVKRAVKGSGLGLFAEEDIFPKAHTLLNTSVVMSQRKNNIRAIVYIYLK